MGFSKKQHLQENIDALRIVFKLEKENRQATVGERLLMMRYSGFGGLKFVLNPAENEIDINNWRKTEHDLFPITQELHPGLKRKCHRRKSSTNGMWTVCAVPSSRHFIHRPGYRCCFSALRNSGLKIDKFSEPSGAGYRFRSYSFQKPTGKCNRLRKGFAHR